MGDLNRQRNASSSISTRERRRTSPKGTPYPFFRPVHGPEPGSGNPATDWRVEWKWMASAELIHRGSGVYLFEPREEPGERQLPELVDVAALPNGTVLDG